MNPLIEIREIFNTPEDFILSFQKESLQYLSADEKNFLEEEKGKSSSSEHAIIYFYFTTHYANNFKLKIKSASIYIENHFEQSKTKSDSEKFIWTCLSHIDSTLKNISNCSSKYSKISTRKDKLLRDFIQASQALYHQDENSPFPYDPTTNNANEENVFMQRLKALKPALDILTRDEILSLLFAFCSEQINNLKDILNRKYLASTHDGLKNNVFNKTNIAAEVKKKQTLLDILYNPLDKKKNKNQIYKEFILFLQKENLENDRPFITKNGNDLQWTKSVFGWQQYMAGFVHTCLKNGWLPDRFTSTEWQQILFNTFNAKPNIKWFKSIKAKPPGEKYLRPFKALPVNL